MTEELVVPYWNLVNQCVEQEILQNKNPNFLQHDVIRYVMYTPPADLNRYTFQLTLLDHVFGVDRTNQILNDEPTLGAPDLIEYRPGLKCSGNSIQMLFHVAWWQYKTGKDIRNIRSFIEWGGGYGALARLIHKINPEAQYTMLDTPTFIDVQQWYLGSVCEDYRQFDFYHAEDIDEIIMPHDMFISTWALSESPRHMINTAAVELAYVDNILLAFQQTSDMFEAASDIVDILNSHRIEDHKILQVEEVPYLMGSGNKYATR